jgi:hypothetical protein
VAIAASFVLAPSVAAAQSCKIPGFTDAAFGDLGVTMTGNACTDSYDSTVPPNTYAGTKCNDPGTPCLGGVGTNATTSGAITLSGANACVKGGCQIGYGGATSSISGSSQCTSTAVEPSTIAMPSVIVPSLPNASPFDVAAAATLTPGKTYGAVTGSGNSSKVLTLTAGTYVMSSLELSGQSSLTIATGPVYVYLNGSGAALKLSGNGINNTTGVATNLIFMCTDSVTNVSVVGNGTTAFGLYCPKAAVSVTGNGDVYGSIVGKTVSMVGNGTVHYDAALGNLTTANIECTTAPVEMSRATPIIAAVSPEYGGTVQTAVVQGSYELPTGTASTISITADIASWTFPYIKGHMRARAISGIGTTASAFNGTICTGAGTPSGCSVVYDTGATGGIPAMGTFTGSGCSAPNGTCRYIFTNTNDAATDGTTVQPTTTSFNANTSSTIGPLIASTTNVPGITNAQQQTIMQKILGAKLGGVDRSSVAVIGASTLAGSSTRPTMAYFGATDGMLHAVCASKVSTGACAGHTGMELWAFIPRVQLPLLRTNAARIDGSPHVIDAFGDFDADGSSGWSTILIFQTGYGTSATPATYALDVTDPEDPHVVWEKTSASSPSSFDLGTGLTVAAGRVGTTQENVAVVVTTNGGSGGAGVVATAIALQTGATKWQFGWLYPSAPRNVAADGPLPSTAIPGGAVAVDIGGLNKVTDFVFGDIYGNLWRLDASTGVSRNGASTPLFSFTTNKHPIGAPPAIYSNGSQQYAVFASGGYTDHGGAAAWRSVTQYVIATKLDSTSTTPANETATPCSTCAVSFKVTTTGQYAFSQVLVVGSQLFVATDSTDVNASSYGGTADTGTVRTVDLVTQTSTTAVLNTGGSALAASGTTLVSSSGQKQQQATSTTGTTGASVDIFAAALVSRLLYLRLD